MKVVIVAKTRMGSGACVGAITFEGRSLRLVASDQQWNDRFNQEYSVGDVWDVDCRPDEHIIPPHVENIVVHDKRRLPPIDDVVGFVEHHMPSLEGSADLLYEGLTRATGTGALYIAQDSGVPSCSTMFWRPDQPLLLDDDGKRIRYRYPTDDGGRTLTFVGFQEPVTEIPAGAILRVSLAHWWKPEEHPDHELRCYVQLSGWFLPQSGTAHGSPPVAVTQPTRQVAVPRSTQAALKEVFGFDEFRAMQEDIVEQVLAKEDTLAVMPTGSGKSLCYQLPALLFPGLTVVVSPLISLMEDQVMQLKELGVPALYLNSTLAYHEYLEATRQIRAGEVKLLYAAPETLLRPETLVMLDQVDVDCLTIDEAHCISEWGHDFRPEYRQLVAVRRRLPNAVCLALTATATEQVCHDIKASLEIPDAQTFIASFNRDNLFLSVASKTDALAQTLELLQAHRGQSGIIYCATRKQVDLLCRLLNSSGWDALPYHAGLDAETRRRHQHRFIRDDTPIIVATIAFGMGINKSNVRFIVHYDLPKDLESYYQQIGRAGRDGLRADCLLLYSYSDVNTINYFIQEQAAEQQRAAQLRLEAMLSFVNTIKCRRAPILAYFGEDYPVDNCGFCDNCTTDRDDLVDLTVAAQKFLSCVKRTGEMYGIGHIIDVLHGSRAQKVLARGHDRLTTYNIGREYSKAEWKHFARQFVDQGLLTRDLTYGGLKLTEKAYAVFQGQSVSGTALARRRSAPSTARDFDYDATLFDLLRDRRKQLADAANLPAYTVFSDRTLAEMATYFPQSEEAFAQLHGVGQAKLDRYAHEFLPLIQEYCAENNIQENRKPAPADPETSQSLGNRTLEVVAFYDGGKSITDIAEIYGVKPRTVIGHLWKAVQSGRKLSRNNVLALSELTDQDQRRAMDAFSRHGLDFLTPVFQDLGETVSYDELHLIRLHMAISDASEKF